MKKIYFNPKHSLLSVSNTIAKQLNEKEIYLNDREAKDAGYDFEIHPYESTYIKFQKYYIYVYLFISITISSIPILLDKVYKFYSSKNNSELFILEILAKLDIMWITTLATFWASIIGILFYRIADYFMQTNLRKKRLLKRDATKMRQSI